MSALGLDRAPREPRPVPQDAPKPAPLVAAWRRGLETLDPAVAPAVGVSARSWPVLLDQLGRFVEVWGDQAEALGFTTCDLFGVHYLAGALRVDSCGALIRRPPWRIVHLGAGIVRSGDGLVWRGNTNPRESVPIWRFLGARS